MFPYKHNFVLNPEILDDSHVRYDLDINIERWPWLKLAPDHPVLIGKHSFFIGIGCGFDLLKLPVQTASALTKVIWKNMPACLHQKHATRALAEISDEDDKFYYGCELLSADAQVMQTMQAWGVVFRKRDYGSWRDRIKNALERTRPQDFNFASAETAGVNTSQECFVSPLHENRKGLSCFALIDARAGFVPLHPWHTGTGDHATASHLLDVAYQAAHMVGHAQGWLSTSHTVHCMGGEALFKKYVELGTPFEITLRSWKPLDNGRALRFSLSQNSAICVDILLELNQ